MRHASSLVTVLFVLSWACSSVGQPGPIGTGDAVVEAGAGGGSVVRMDGVVLQSTPDRVENVRLTRLGESDKAVTWRQIDAGGVGHEYYAYTREGAVPTAWSRAIEGDNTILELRWERFDPLAEGGAKALAVPAHLAAGADHRAFIVQFIVPPTDALRTPVERLGGLVCASLPASAMIFDLDPKSLDAVRALPGVRWVGPYQPAYKCEPSILRGYLSKFGAADPAARERFRKNWGEPYVLAMGQLAEGLPASFWIQVHRSGVPMKQVVAQAIGRLGGVVQDLTPDDNLLRAMLTQEQLVGVLGLSEVAFVDPWGPAQTDMDIVRQTSGANALEAATGFFGKGVRGELMDTGIRATHQAFSVPGPAPIIRLNSTDTSHGTSTFGIVFGDGSGNAAGRGLLADAEAKYIYAYSGLSGFGGTASRLTVTTASVQQNRIVFQSNSWGSALTTAYTTLSQGMDQIIFDTGLLICQSQSNNSNQQSRPEAWAKNVLAVGAFNHQNTLARTDDTVGGGSIGPAADGRIKPELAHFYDLVLTTANTSDTGYTTSFGGTSAATPITCGHMGLLFQMWHEGLFPGFGQRASVFESRPYQTTARALAIHSAYRYTWTAGGSNASINRNVQGWGSVDVARLMALAPSLYVENEAKNLRAGQSASYTFDVPAGSPMLAATMAYADPPGTVSSTIHRINDLSLRVVGPTGTIWWGNNGLSASNSSASGGVSNSRDTLENVFVANPPAGRYSIEVFADIVTQDGNPRTPGVNDVSYALVVSGAARTPVRILTLNANRTGGCTLGDDLALTDSPVFASARQWLADPSLFGGAGPLDRPVQLLAAIPAFTPTALAGADMVVITGLATTLSSCERSLLTQFVRQGGGVFALYDNAAQDLGPVFGAIAGGPGAGGGASSLDPVPGAPLLAGPFGAVAASVPGGSCRVFDALGPNGTALLMAASRPVAAAFTLDSGRAVLVNDMEWAAGASILPCVVAPPTNGGAKALFLNALASVVPPRPIQFAFSCCPVADFNGSGALEVQDLFDFLNAWLAGDPRADFNGGGLSSQDIFDFVDAWIAGGC
jgi:hypothetical protein